MRMDLYTYVIEDKWKKPHSDMTLPKYGYIGCEYNFPSTIIEKNVDVPMSKEEKDGMIILSFCPPEWSGKKRFARLILTKEEARKLKKQL